MRLLRGSCSVQGTFRGNLFSMLHVETNNRFEDASIKKRELMAKNVGLSLSDTSAVSSHVSAGEDMIYSLSMG